ncbi:hypothetical protein NPIL_573301 [Nephila pilipes]|uniref:Uncharacterized protein n=1 Tax=Nephila pilipes TaxID=299642 RepID=A0A8X6TX55_NEPPI|nr:hypothetical protein NPIL_573301 [Nephila pilipes]
MSGNTSYRSPGSVRLIRICLASFRISTNADSSSDFSVEAAAQIRLPIVSIHFDFEQTSEKKTICSVFFEEKPSFFPSSCSVSYVLNDNERRQMGHLGKLNPGVSKELYCHMVSFFTVPEVDKSLEKFGMIGSESHSSKQPEMES